MEIQIFITRCLVPWHPNVVMKYYEDLSTQEIAACRWVRIALCFALVFASRSPLTQLNHPG